MINDDLCYSDNMKILRFIDEMIVEPADFRGKVLDLFSDIFNYDKSTFWLIDDSKEIHSPLVKNLDDEAINKYMAGYYRDDFFHPDNMNIDIVLKKKVLLLEDIITRENYENSGYYCDFLSNYNIYDEIGVFFTEKNKLIGGMALLRSREDRPYNRKDAIILEFLSKHISSYLYNNNELIQKGFMNNILMNFTKNSRDGLLVVDGNTNPIFCNKAFHDILDSIWGQNKNIGFFLGYLDNNYPNWKRGLSVELVSRDMSRFHLRISSVKGEESYNCKDAIKLKIFEIEDINKACNDLGGVTRREREVLNLLRKGFSNEEISEELIISIYTTKKHIRNLFLKIGAKSRTELIWKAFNRI